VGGDLVVDGNIDFSQIAVGLGGTPAATDLEIGGGTIVGSSDVSRKTYSKTFSIGVGDAKDIQLMFGNGAFYARITAILRRRDGSTVGDINTMILDVQGGTSDASAPTLDVAVGELKLFGGTNSFPWSPVLTAGQRGISLVPYNTENSRVYDYDIFVELTTETTNCGGKLEKITRNLAIANNINNGVGGQTTLATFNY
jgi:hypothetical protein